MSVISKKGATLLEMVLAAVIAVASVAMISLTFPKAAQNLMNNRRRWLASNFANQRIQEIKTIPYLELDPTPSTNFPVSGSGPTGCNCAAEDLSNPIYSDRTISEGGTTYEIHACINLAEGVGSTTISHCPDGFMGYAGADKGLKFIKVRVLWSSAGTSYVTDQESMLIR